MKPAARPTIAPSLRTIGAVSLPLATWLLVASVAGAALPSRISADPRIAVASARTAMVERINAFSAVIGPARTQDLATAAGRANTIAELGLLNEMLRANLTASIGEAGTDGMPKQDADLVTPDVTAASLIRHDQMVMPLSLSRGRNVVNARGMWLPTPDGVGKH